MYVKYKDNPYTEMFFIKSLLPSLSTYSQNQALIL